jgi:hypothetical protein
MEGTSSLDIVKVGNIIIKLVDKGGQNEAAY